MSWTDIDRDHIWHPYTQEKTAGVPIPIVKGEGSWLIDQAGKRYLDAISSWWVTAHGHSHPHIAKRVSEQLLELEHCIFAGFTHPRAAELTKRLLHRIPYQDKVFFSDNGSTAVEVALKMAFQYWHNSSKPKKTVVAIDGAYHGDTFGAMAVSGRSAFNAPFSPFLFDVVHIPFPGGETAGEAIKAFETRVAQGDVAAFIYEPLVQGASGMRVMDPDALQRLLALAQQHEVIAIADEVFTGFGRTGKWFASDYLASKPDIMCFSKALTGGAMALGVTTCKDFLYQAFLSDDPLKTFFHGHSFTANPLACAAACASFDLFDEPETWQKIDRISAMHRTFCEELRGNPLLSDVRSLGTILALDLETGSGNSYFNPVRAKAYSWFMGKGLLLRPLGNTLYAVPPYCTTADELELIYEGIRGFLKEIG